MTDKFGFIHIGKTGGTAFNAVLRDHKKNGTGEFVGRYGHRTTLEMVADGDMTRNLIFFVREPVARFISAFNSRLRQGYPRYQGEWGPEEARAFEMFKTPNQLAEALGSDDEKTREDAVFAMNSIRHLKRAYKRYLGSVKLLEREKDRIFFIGTTESFNDDFEILRKLLKIDPSIELPMDDVGAHKTPEGFERTISEIGRKNVEAYYERDFEIYRWCLKRREELLPIRRAEAAA